MADYKTLKGYKVASLASDPTVNKGQLWYNTASNTLKYDGVGAAAWASGANVSVAVETGMSFGTSTSAILVGGMTESPAVAQNTSFSYNGTAWTEEATIGTARRWSGGLGASATAGLIVGGAPPSMALTEVYNGTSWTEVNPINRNVESVAGSGGTVTAGLCAGGEPGPGIQVETWDGTNWTEVGDLNAAHNTAAATAFGSPTAFQVAGGAPSYKATSEQYNGTTWTEVGDLNVAVYGNGGAGTTSSMISYGGIKSPAVVVGTTEQWNGTSWTEIADLAQARLYMAVYNGTGTAALAISGRDNPSGVFVNVESWDNEPVGVNTVTTS